MDEDVAKATNLLPGDVWCQSLMFRADSADRFRHDLKIAENRVLHKRTRAESFAAGIIPSPARVFIHTPNAFEDVFRIKEVLLQRATFRERQPRAGFLLSSGDAKRTGW